MNKMKILAVAVALATTGTLGMAHAALTANPSYQVILGHDGHPDQDDNLAILAGTITAIHQAESNNKVSLIGFIYGDTTAVRKSGMINGGTTDDNKAKANYAYYKQYAKAAVQDLGISPIYDVTTQTANFNANSLSAMTTGGQLVATQLQQAIDQDLDVRIVLSAGGGQNSAAEAIKYLKNKGYTDAEIKARFAIVQHSGWNAKNATESTAQTITLPFTIRIEDQNKFSGSGKLTHYADSKRTGQVFATAWKAARDGQNFTNIANHKSTSDGSDGGSHHFATNLTILQANWNNRAGTWWTQVDPSQAIKYSSFNTSVSERDVTCKVASDCADVVPTSPVVTVTSPSDGASIAATSNVVMNVNVTDDVAVLKARFFLDGTYVGQDLSAPYSYNFGNLSVGNHTLTVEGVDSPEKNRTQKSVTITVTSNSGSEFITDLNVTNPSCDRMVLSWSDTINGEGYRVRRKKEGDAAYVNIADVGVGVGAYTDTTNLVDNANYLYMVRPLESGVTVSVSNVITIKNSCN